MSNITKLTPTNYLMWSRQVHALLDGYDLAGYIDGSITAPSETINTAGTATTNTAYKFWKRQDKLIYSAILGTITVTIQPLLSRSNTAAEIWDTLKSTYATPSWGHLQQVRQHIKQWSKGTKTITEYFQGHTTRFDELALLGKPLDHDEQVEFILGGLTEDYKSVVDQTENRDKPPTLTELLEKLLNREAKLMCFAATVPTIPVTAHAANYKGNNNNHYNNNNRNNKSNGRSSNNTNWQQNNFQPKQNQYTPKPYQGKCQICGIHGHGARRCSQLQGNMYNPNQSTQASPFTLWQPRANAVMASPYNANNWLLDSGATHHITSDLANLSLHHPYTGGEDVTIADGSGLSISHTGSTLLSTPSRSLALKDVLYVPNIHKNLISVYRMCNTNKVSVEFFPAHFQVKDLKTGAQLLQGRTRVELYEWPVNPKNPSSLLTTTTPKTDLISWHSRLGHPSLSTLKAVVSQFSLPVSQSLQKQLNCSDCLLNKTHKLPFHTNTIVSTQPLEYLYTDLWTSPIMSIDDYKYYLVLVDHHTRYSWFYPIKQKSHVKDVFMTFKALVENKFQRKITHLYSDNGGEFIALRSFLSINGITHLTTPPHTPEHNGISERKHRHIVETGLTLLGQASMPKSYWSYAFTTAIYLINRMPSDVIGGSSPYKRLFGQAPNYLKLRVFGCLCFPWLRPYASHKLDDRSAPCVFIGYSMIQSAYLCLNRTTGRIYTSRHVQFVESTFPFANPRETQSPSLEESTPPSFASQMIPVPISSLPLVQPSSYSPPTRDPHLQRSMSPATPSPPHSPTSSPTCSTNRESQHQTREEQSQEASSPNSLQLEPGPLSPTTTSKSPSETTKSPSTSNRPPPNTTPSSSSSAPIPSPNPSPQPENQQPQEPQNQHPMRTRGKNNISKPIKKLTLAASLKAKSKIPSSVAEALRDPNWRKAMSDEFNAVLRNGTYELVPSEPHYNIVGCR